MRAVLTNEKIFSVCAAGSALEADKKINLAIKISVNVHVAEASRATAQGPSINGRGNSLYPASGLSLARPTGNLRTLELCLYPLASLVPGGIMGQIAASVGPEGARPIALFGRQPYQGASRCKQPRWRPTKSGHWSHQGRSEYQAWGLGRRTRTSDQSKSGGRTGSRGNHGTSIARPALRGTVTVADKAYDSDGFRAQLRRWGSRPCIPPRSNRLRPVSWHRGHYRRRHKVENLFQRLKRYRRIGTRYEKNDPYFMGFVQLAAILDWLKN